MYFEDNAIGKSEGLFEELVKFPKGRSHFVLKKLNLVRLELISEEINEVGLAIGHGFESKLFFLASGPGALQKVPSLYFGGLLETIITLLIEVPEETILNLYYSPNSNEMIPKELNPSPGVLIIPFDNKEARFWIEGGKAKLTHKPILAKGAVPLGNPAKRLKSNF